MIIVILRQPERLRDEEIDDLEQQLQSQARGSAPQPTVITQEEPPIPSNCFKFQNKVFGESKRLLLSLSLVSCVLHRLCAVDLSHSGD